MSEIDIVERLRGGVQYGWDFKPSVGGANQTMSEAADVIEFLRTRISEMDAELTASMREIDRLRGDVQEAREKAIEECAQVAESHPGTNFANASGRIDWRRATTHDVAAAIRALAEGGECE